MEKHHVVPVSIGGENFPENIVELERVDHEIIHAFLNVSHKSLRQFRLKTNHIAIKPNTYYVKELCSVQNLYFSKIVELPKNLINIHADAIEALCYRQKREFNIKPGKQILFQSPLLKFKHFLCEYHKDKLIYVNKR